MKLAVAKQIKEYWAGGGFLFAMCSGTDSFDIALAAEGVDICAQMFDGDPADPNAQSKLDYTKTLAFQNFKLDTNPMNYEFSDIDAGYRNRQKPDRRENGITTAYIVGNDEGFVPFFRSKHAKSSFSCIGNSYNALASFALT